MLPERGSFVAVVGASGVGKDSVLAAACARLADAPNVVFARRVVTRAPGGGEDNVALPAEAFRLAAASGAFCLEWDAHDLSYALPAELADMVANGRTVVANLSRKMLPAASDVFSRLVVVEIAADTSLLRQRLLARGRETAAEVDARLARHAPLNVPPTALHHFRIDNSGPLDRACDHFVDCLARIDATIARSTLVR